MSTVCIDMKSVDGRVSKCTVCHDEYCMARTVLMAEVSGGRV